jgi:hypothetical protein
LPAGWSASAQFIHSNGKLYALFNDIPYHSGTSPNTYVGIRVDPNASGDALAQGNDVAFLVNEAGTAWLAYGDGAGDMPPSTQPPAGYAAVVNRGEQSWSAELEINESLLGGWNHAARIKLGVYWINYTGDDRNWPQLANYASPATWAPAWFGTTAPQPENRPPVANAGDDIRMVASVRSTITLDGTRSYDPDGDPMNYAWTQVSGPAVTLSGASTATPSFEAGPVTEETHYVFGLIVDDSQAGSFQNDVEVTLLPGVLPQPTATPTPEATATAEPTAEPTASPTAEPTASPSPTATPITHDTTVAPIWANLSQFRTMARPPMI